MLAKPAPAVQATSLSDFSNKMEKNVLNGDGIDARFSIRYVSGNIFVDVAVKDEALTDVNLAGFEMLFYADEVPTGDTAVPLTKDSPGEIVSFRSSDLFFEFEEGVDYAIVDGKIHLLEGTRIPVVKYEDYYPSAQTRACSAGRWTRLAEAMSPSESSTCSL